jgi:hypothetical protein
VRFFAPRDGHFQVQDIARPETIYAPGIGSGSESRRPMQTVEPLAKLIGIAISNMFLKGRESELAAAVLREDGIVLISWEHKVIKDIVKLIGGPDLAPPAWPEDRFDIVFVLDRTDEGWTLTQVPEMLLAGDSEDRLE